jgi:prepilin-type N-terminal cleavage/methylation domain-containing protein
MYMRRRDDGFTLIEALVAILVLGVITLALSNVVIGYVRNSDATTARLAESHDAQISAAYWAKDVASIGTRNSSNVLQQSVDTTNSGSWAYPCALTGTTPVVRLVWDDFNSGKVRVAYVFDSTKRELRRLVCDNAGSLTSNIVLAHDLAASTTPAVACLTVTSSTSCTGTGTEVPQWIALAMSIKDPKNTGSSYAMTLTGQRRQT